MTPTRLLHASSETDFSPFVPDRKSVSDSLLYSNLGLLPLQAVSKSSSGNCRTAQIELEFNRCDHVCLKR